MTDLPLAQMADAVLRTADGRAKTALSRKFAAQWQTARANGDKPEIGSASPPMQPARPDQPALLDPRDVPRRKPGTADGRIAILHAVAHIELNAVDLHWDIIARFTDTPMPIGFYDDWVKSADEESKHFNLMCDCLEAQGSHYGALAAHAGMWRAAEDTAGDLMGRLAVVPMVLEARGLDVTPGMIRIFQQTKDQQPLFSWQPQAALQRGKARRGRYSSRFLLAFGRRNRTTALDLGRDPRTCPWVSRRIFAHCSRYPSGFEHYCAKFLQQTPRPVNTDGHTVGWGAGVCFGTGTEGTDTCDHALLKSCTGRLKSAFLKNGSFCALTRKPGSSGFGLKRNCWPGQVGPSPSPGQLSPRLSC